MPSSRKNKAKKAATKSKGSSSPFVDNQPTKTYEEKPLLDKSSGAEEGSDMLDVFYDAADRTSIGYRDFALAPSVGTTETHNDSDRNTESRVAELERDPLKRLPHFPRYYPRTRYSVGVQTTPGGKGSSKTHSLTPRVLHSEMETLGSLENLSSDEEFEDARESLIDGDDVLQQQGGRRRVRSNVKSRRCKNQKAQTRCPEKTCQRSGPQNGDELEKECTVIHQTGHDHGPEASCCTCLLTVIYWIAVMLFISLLLSLFLTIFLLFSRNHGLGIGPGFLYTDVDLIRNQVNPHLDLRHKAPPPT